MSGALSHIRVLDLTRILAGPWSAQLLADLGAEVIKIERPGVGDDTRSWGPPFLKDTDGEETKESAYFLSTNRNKKSVTVDFTKPEGQAIVRNLAEDVDIVLENFKFEGLKQYGLDYASLSAINPRLIYLSITGFGQTGPYASRAGYDFLIQAMGGLMSITGPGAGSAGDSPQKVGVAIVDILTGLYGTIGVLSALASREVTGRGQHIDVALLDVQIASLAYQNMNYLISGTPPERMGNAHPNIVPYEDFPTRDGAMIIAVGNDAQFERLCWKLGHPEWARDERFATNSARVENRKFLIGEMRQTTVKKTTKEWADTLESVGVPCGPINTLKEVFEDPHVIARGMRLNLPHPLAGSVASVANPLRMSQTPLEYKSAPPTLGQNTQEILMAKLGLSADEIKALSNRGVI